MIRAALMGTCKVHRKEDGAEHHHSRYHRRHQQPCSSSTSCGGASMGWHSCRLDFSDIVWICAKARGAVGGWVYLYGRTPPPARFGCGKHVGCASRCIHAPDPSANSMMRSCRLGQPPSRGACTLSLHQSELELGPTSTAPHPASLAPSVNSQKVPHPRGFEKRTIQDAQSGPPTTTIGPRASAGR